MASQKSMPPKTLFVSIEKNEYEVKFPNSGEELDIMILIQRLSNDKYDNLKLSPFIKMQREALKCEAIAHFAILAPKMKQDLNVKSLLDLSRSQMDVVTAAYVDQLFPWMEEWEAILSDPKEDQKKDETQK